MITLELYELNTMLTAAAQMGAERALDAVGCKKDIMRYSEAERYLKARGLKACTLRKMKEEGLVVFSKGKAKNSPLVCKKSDLVAALAAMQVKSLTV